MPAMFQPLKKTRRPIEFGNESRFVPLQFGKVGRITVACHTIILHEQTHRPASVAIYPVPTTLREQKESTSWRIISKDVYTRPRLKRWLTIVISVNVSNMNSIVKTHTAKPMCLGLYCMVIQQWRSQIAMLHHWCQCNYSSKLLCQPL